MAKDQEKNEDLRQSLRQYLAEEIKSAFEIFQEKLSAIHKTIEGNRLVNEEQIRLHGEHILFLDRMLTDHLKVCNDNKKEMSEVLDAVRTIRAGMKITNYLRNAAVWIAGLAVPVAAAIQFFKDHFK